MFCEFLKIRFFEFPLLICINQKLHIFKSHHFLIVFFFELVLYIIEVNVSKLIVIHDSLRFNFSIFEFTIVVIFGGQTVNHHEHFVSLLLIHFTWALGIFVKLSLKILSSNINEFLTYYIFILIIFEFCINKTQE